MSLGESGELLHVERLVLEHFHCPSMDDVAFSEAIGGGGWEGFHDEGAVLRSLFSLLMWEILFTSLPDVFISPFQDAPLDLFFPSFYESRYVLSMEYHKL